MPAKLNLTGQRFGRLAVIRYAGMSRHGKSTWECRCDCGSVVTLLGSNMVFGLSRSCGCLEIESKRSVPLIHGHTRGHRPTREFRIWANIQQRCLNPQCPTWKRYGARGVTVCERWRSFPLFLADMGKCPSPHHSIERKDNNGNYEPDNCVWATIIEQANNRSNNHLLTLDGTTLTIAQWAREKGFSGSKIYARLKLGWTVERALTT